MSHREHIAERAKPVRYTGNMADLSDLDPDGVRSRRGYWDGASKEMRRTAGEKTLRGGLSPCSGDTERLYQGASCSVTYVD